MHCTALHYTALYCTAHQITAAHCILVSLSEVKCRVNLTKKYSVLCSALLCCAVKYRTMQCRRVHCLMECHVHSTECNPRVELCNRHPSLLSLHPSLLQLLPSATATSPPHNQLQCVIIKTSVKGMVHMITMLGPIVLIDSGET